MNANRIPGESTGKASGSYDHLFVGTLPPPDNAHASTQAKEHSGHTTSNTFLSRTTGVAVRAMLAAEGDKGQLPSDREDRANIRTLGYALSKLPPAERARWAEEWVSDLTSVSGRFAKLRLRLGIRVNARRMGKQPILDKANVPNF